MPIITPILSALRSRRVARLAAKRDRLLADARRWIEDAMAEAPGTDPLASYYASERDKQAAQVQQQIDQLEARAA